jgi:hypothetical protein
VRSDFGFGSFRKIGGPQRLSAFSVSRTGPGDRPWVDLSGKRRGNTCRFGVDERGRVLSYTQPVGAGLFGAAPVIHAGEGLFFLPCSW